MVASWFLLTIGNHLLLKEDFFVYYLLQMIDKLYIHSEYKVSIKGQKPFDY